MGRCESVGRCWSFGLRDLCTHLGFWGSLVLQLFRSQHLSTYTQTNFSTKGDGGDCDAVL